jgi:hypothetical protein
MSFAEYYKNLEAKAKTYTVTTVILVVINVMLTILTAYSFSQRVVKIQLPPTRLTESIIIANNEVSASMFSMWARFIVSTAANYTPDTIEDNVFILMSMAAPSSYSELNTELQELMEHIKTNRVRQTFYPVWDKSNTEIRGNYAIVHVPGKTIRFIGPNKEEINNAYSIKMLVDEGHMYLAQLSKEKK